MTLPNQQQPQVQLSELEAYEFIKYNWKHGRIQQAANYVLKDVEELRRIGNLGRVLNIPHPDWKENELYKLVSNEWEYFSTIGCIKDFTPLLSYRAVTHIFMVYKFELKVDYSRIPKVAVKKPINFKYTEDQSYAILEANETKLVNSMGVGFSIADILQPTLLTKVLKTNQTYLYKLLKEKAVELESLGCTKTTKWNLTFRGVLFLLIEQEYSLELKLEQPKVVSIQTKQPVIDNNKPNIKLITQFLDQKRIELKALSEADRKKAEVSRTNLQIVEDAYWHIETAQNLLEEVGIHAA